MKKKLTKAQLDILEGIIGFGDRTINRNIITKKYSKYSKSTVFNAIEHLVYLGMLKKIIKLNVRLQKVKPIKDNINIVFLNFSTIDDNEQLLVNINHINF